MSTANTTKPPPMTARSLLRRAAEARLSGIVEFRSGSGAGRLVISGGRVAWADGIDGLPSLAHTLAKLAGVSPKAIARRAGSARDKGFDLPKALQIAKPKLRAAMRDYLATALNAALRASGPVRFHSQPVAGRPECSFSLEELSPYTHGMPAEQDALRSILEPGQIEACALIDARTTELLAVASLAESRDLELAAVLAATVITASKDAVAAQDTEALEDVIITSGSHFRILRPMRGSPGQFIYAEACRGSMSLALARRALGELELTLTRLAAAAEAAIEAV